MRYKMCIRDRFIADQGLDSISMEPVVTELPDLEIKAEHLPAIEKEYENLCDEYLRRLAEGKGFNFFHFNIDLELSLIHI